ncbi:MAG: hypothetical protein Q9220_002007 [cf. Caloplaca sp. 1 TL-2023]
MAVRGQRFNLDLDSEEEGPPQDHVQNTSVRGPMSLVTDIQERPPSTATRPPSPPSFKNSQDGFPAHKNRIKRPGASKERPLRRRGQENKPQSHPREVPRTTEISGNKEDEPSERHKIDVENKRRIAEMSSEDIEQARKELMTGLSSSLIEKLLKKANIEEDINVETGIETTKERGRVSPKSSQKNVHFDLRDSEESIPPQSPRLNADPDDGNAPTERPLDAQTVSTFSGYPTPPSFHFPRPPTPPSLDPEDPEFLSKLHSTYFPSLPANPNALSWMQPPDPTESEAYSPSQENMMPSAVRFDFRGRLLPPRLAAQILPTKGLHHHGTAPEAAGYTIPELAHLSRSSFPSQRCIAYQTLGRILYRLGTGVFGPEDHELCQGLWKCIDQGRVLDTLTEEAARDERSGNRSCWVTATEAVWLWRKGGGRKWKAA